MRPSLLKKLFALSKCVFPGMIPQKQGTSQFIGSRKRGFIVSLAISGAKVSSRVGVTVGESVALRNLAVLVGEGVAVDTLAVTVGTGVSVSGMVGVSVEVGIVVAVDEGIVGDGRLVACVGCIVGLAGAQPGKERAKTKKRDNQDRGA